MLPAAFIPTPRLAVEYLRRRRFERIQAHEEKGRLRQWFLLCGRADQRSLLAPRPDTLHKLFPSADRAWADPFLWKRGDDYYVFCEEWLYSEPHAHIAVMQVSAEGLPLSSSAPVLQLDHHLSYPFLFEHEGVLHMLPEGGQGRSVDVYECEAFPDRWRKRATLMKDLHYADATLCEHAGKWWLFIGIKRGLLSFNRDLFVFWADTPLSNQWRAHPGNPILRALTGARPAGRMFKLDGKLFRPSQNCLVRYGYSLKLNEITVLDTRHYEERLVKEVTPDWEKDIRANHHIDWHAGLVVMDAQRLLPARV
jgi:hypothetical protein